MNDEFMCPKCVFWGQRLTEAYPPAMRAVSFEEITSYASDWHNSLIPEEYTYSLKTVELLFLLEVWSKQARALVRGVPHVDLIRTHLSLLDRMPAAQPHLRRELEGRASRVGEIEEKFAQDIASAASFRVREELREDGTRDDAEAAENDNLLEYARRFSPA